MSIFERLKAAISPSSQEQAPSEIDSWVERFLKAQAQHGEDALAAIQATPWKDGKSISDADRQVQADVVAAMIPRIAMLDRSAESIRSQHPNGHPSGKAWDSVWTPRTLLFNALSALTKKTLPLSEATLVELASWIGQASYVSSYWHPLSAMMRAITLHCTEQPPSMELRHAMIAVRERAKGSTYFERNQELRKLVAEIENLLGTAPSCQIVAGEAWSDAALADLAAMDATRRAAWLALINHCQSADASTPTGKWNKEAAKLLSALGAAEFKAGMTRWLPLVDKPRTDLSGDGTRTPPEYAHPHTIIPPHAEILKGLAWVCGLVDDPDIARLVTALTLSTYRKVPGLGPRLVKVGNAGVYALGAMPGRHALAQLAILKVRVRFGTAQKSIEKALTATAERLGLPREDIEEIAASSYGLTEVGRMTEQLGDFTAVLEVAPDGGTELTWRKADGKVQKSLPAEIKTSFPEELAEIRTAAKDIERMLPAQRERIDSLFLQQKRWAVETWRERYLDHPLIGVIARRLLWDFISPDGQCVTGVFLNGSMVDLDLRPVTTLENAETRVELWHPVGKTIDDVVAWRGWFDTQKIQQPFKQAYREIYLLTDAERSTRIYSNRFAAHVLRQHQFNALCAARSWKNKLRLLVDAEYPPATRELTAWGLRAEFWIEGIGDNYGGDTNESGAYLRLSTDQVRFYRTGAAQRHAHAGGGGYGRNAGLDEALALAEIPPLVFSEIMRDVDLFVGVASVGNDPTWSDGGPQGRFRDYWQNYSFGELSATAQTRRAVLQTLVPRLKIADRCALGEKFLQVRGDLRSYKIHLGSGNILMTPNDQYLCIVPRQSASATADAVMLPFEGDTLLSVILSKAFLLAEDTKIKDPTIVSQIRR
jgi:hypothetical protein